LAGCNHIASIGVRAAGNRKGERAMFIIEEEAAEYITKNGGAVTIHWQFEPAMGG
jgi:hypothetical protein